MGGAAGEGALVTDALSDRALSDRTQRAYFCFVSSVLGHLEFKNVLGELSSVTTGLLSTGPYAACSACPSNI